MHNLLNAHFDLRNYPQFHETLKEFEDFSGSTVATQHDNNRIQTFVYINSAKLNQHIMEGTFTKGILLVPKIEAQLKEYNQYLDRHRILVFNYKIAMFFLCIFFG